MAKKDNKQDKVDKDVDNKTLPFRKSDVRDWFEVIMYGLALLMFVKSFVFQNFQIPTSSMENSLLIGDHLMANKFVFGHAQWDWERKLFPFRPIRRGDVLVFKYPGDIRQDYIKRCIGLPGENVALKSDIVFVDGVPLDERYTYYKEPQDPEKSYRDPDNKNRPYGYDELKPGLEHGVHMDSEFLDQVIAQQKKAGKPPSERTVNFVEVTTEQLVQRTKRTFGFASNSDHLADQNFWDHLVESGEAVIPEGFYLMMGDNRNNSLDSRFWGLVPESYVEGRAYVVWWSYGEDEGSHTLKGTQLIWSYARVPFRFFTHTRWDLSMKRIK
ncbi:MAG: signal peptidase I [Acidobacteria bacterium]|nr:signal peptidase I [Acidobacteriota bacterium]